MPEIEWGDVRDEMIGKVEAFLDSLGWDAASIAISLRGMGIILTDDESGQTVIEDAISSVAGIDNVDVGRGCAYLRSCRFQMSAKLPLPLPVKEFIRGWNEGILQ